MSEQILDQNAVVESSEDAVFDDIRPCRDDEAQQELAVIANDESLVNGIVRLRYPKLSRFIGPLLKIPVRSYIKNAVRKINSIEDFQMQVAAAVTRMIDNTTDGVTFRGFEKLNPDRGYLFISNHRDISLDPCFIDFAYHSYYNQTVRIAIGDNLLKMPAATALMRLNKSFIVKRSVTLPRERLKEVNHLSHYIGLSLKEGHSIWIAQREGRAKDGNDCTEEAVLKMLHMYGRKQGKSFGEYMSSLNIVPVSITYEYDPGDVAKANELEERARNDGKYQKSEFEDIRSIIKGINDYKGRVCIVAGDPVSGGFETPSQLAALIDRFIYLNYEFYPSVMLAAHGLGLCGDDEIASISTEDRNKFNNRLQGYPEHLHKRIMQMYAYPYINRKRAADGELDFTLDNVKESVCEPDASEPAASEPAASESAASAATE